MTIAAVTGVRAARGRAGLRADQHRPAGRRRARPGDPGRRSPTAARDAARWRRGTRSPDALTEGFQSAFLVGAGFAVAGAVLAAVLISSRDSREHAEAAQRGEVAAAVAA